MPSLIRLTGLLERLGYSIQMYELKFYSEFENPSNVSIVQLSLLYGSSNRCHECHSFRETLSFDYWNTSSTIVDEITYCPRSLLGAAGWSTSRSEAAQSYGDSAT